MAEEEIKQHFEHAKIQDNANIVTQISDVANLTKTRGVAQVYGALIMSGHLTANYEIVQKAFQKQSQEDFQKEWMSVIQEENKMTNLADVDAVLGLMWKTQRKMIQDAAFAYVDKHAAKYNEWIGKKQRKDDSLELAGILENVGMADAIGYICFYQDEIVAGKNVLSYFQGKDTTDLFVSENWRKERVTWAAGKIGGSYQKEKEIHQLFMGFYVSVFKQFRLGRYVFSKNVGLDQKFFLHANLLKMKDPTSLKLPPVNMNGSGDAYQAVKQKKIGYYKSVA